MSIKHTDLGKEQEAPPRESQSLSTADTVQQGKVSPQESFPPPPRRPWRSNKSLWFAVAAVVVVVALIFSVFALVLAQQGQHPTIQVTPTPTAPGATVTRAPGSDTTVTPAPGVTQGPQNGPSSVSDPAYWGRILGITGTERKVASVSFANMLGNPTLQALVTVRHSDANGTLDVYVFDKITSTKPVQLFKMAGLIKGDAKISHYSSVMTAEVERTSTLNAGKSSAQWTADLFREFAWSQGEGTLVPTAFPGLFPDLTRYQAEMDQNAVKTGQDPWKTHAVQVAQRMAAQLLQWPASAPATLVSGGGPQDVDAVVQVKGPNPGGMSINVTLSRLEGNTSNMWVVVGVTSGNGLLTITPR